MFADERASGFYKVIIVKTTAACAVTMCSGHHCTEPGMNVKCLHTDKQAS